MIRNVIRVVVIIISVAAVRLCSASETVSTDDSFREPVLHIHLPREASVESTSFNLGQVGIILGDPSLAGKASGIGLGRFSVPGQKIVMDRAVLLNRLASSGIPASQVSLTGAEQVTVQRRHQIITAEEVIEFADMFLKKCMPASVGRFEPVRVPKDLVLAGGSDSVELSARLARGGARNQAKVEIAVLRDEKQIATREAVFRLQYNSHRMVAANDIPRGAMLSPENVKIEESLADRPEPADWKPPYGAVVKRPIAAGSPISSRMIGPARPRVLVKRNETVVIQVDKPGLLVTAVGKALQDGPAGQFIKVQNVDSKRIILAKVNDDGTVEPVF
jgi:flagella basal body P-ring formation protein FlgA